MKKLGMNHPMGPLELADFGQGVIAGLAPRQQQNRASSSSSVASSNFLGMAVPALLTRTSGRPRASTVLSTAALTASGLLLSA